RADASAADLCRRLEAQRLEPLRPYLEGTRRLFVVPTWEMPGVPVEALTDRYVVSYLPSGTQLVRLAEQPRPSAAATLLALGDPAFAPPEQRPSQEPTLLVARGPRPAELPGTGREVRALAALFAEPTLLLRGDASAPK